MQRDIIAPLVEKVYTIKNSTIGGYAIRIIGASGSGVVIPNGVTASVYCDGTNFYPLQVNTIGNQTINGNLSVTGTTSLTGALSASTATFSGAISSVNPSFTGVPTAPTAPAGTNTTQIATTAFVTNVASTLGTMSTQNANNVNITGGTISGVTFSGTWTSMPAGTVVVFAQAAAPTGWTQITSDSANNRMLRVVNTAGAGTGGSNSPILNDVVPSHTHDVFGSTGYQSNDHSHYVGGPTGSMNTNWGHTHSVNDPGHYHDIPNLYYETPNQGNSTWSPVGNNTRSNNLYTTASKTTGISLNYTDINHVHGVGIQSGGVSANHSHAIAIASNANAGAANWTPRYIDTIICSKN